MDERTKLIEFRTRDGQVLFQLIMTEKEIGSENSGGTNSEPPANQDNEPVMTDAQKRYLFRLLADQGVEGDRAHDKLKTDFRVTTLKEVSKLDASRMIERLIQGGKGGAKNGPPLQ